MNFIGRTKNAYTQLKDRAIGNIGNFTPAYCEILEHALGKRTKVHRLHWPSGNHHLARLRGAFQLIDLLSEIDPPAEERVLIIGHSHAGQIFANVTQLVSQAEKFMSDLEQHLELFRGLEKKELEKKILRIKKINLDFVTLGASPRYDWKLPDNWQLVHFLNFRKNLSKKLSLFNLLLADYGDSIYLLAGPGSDWPSLYRKDREANLKFDKKFGIGKSLMLWILSVKTGFKIHSQGKLVLINYQDQGLKNIFTSFLGHGIYTHPSFMLSNFKIICEEIYEKGKKSK